MSLTSINSEGYFELFDLKEPRQRAAFIHLEQLQGLSLKEPLEETDPEGAGKHSISLELLKKWSRDNKEVIDIAKKQRAFGPKQKDGIDWNNTFLAFMESCAMYLRDVKSLNQAVSIETEVMGRVRTKVKPDEADKKRLLESIALWEKSQEQINELAKEWGMEFMQLCDLLDEGPIDRPDWSGPYCGAFYCLEKENPFIGIGFKGTNAKNYREVLVDLAFGLIEPDPGCLFGKVSKGVYTGLFKPFKDKDAAIVIISAVIDTHVAPQLPIQKDIMTHITGHSLGASYSSFCYAQFLIGGDLSPKTIQLGDFYNFGSPRIGSNDWAVGFFEKMITHEGANWRIVNAGDSVTNIPPVTMVSSAGFRHIDGGMKIEADKSPENIPTERNGPEPPPGIPKISDEHFPDSYYASLQSALGK